MIHMVVTEGHGGGHDGWMVVMVYPWISRSKSLWRQLIVLEASHNAGRLSWRHIWEAGPKTSKSRSRQKDERRDVEEEEIRRERNGGRGVVFIFS